MVASKNLQFRKRHNRELEVLVESGKDGLYHGYDQYYNKIEIKSSMDLAHNWVYIQKAEVGDGINVASFDG